MKPVQVGPGGFKGPSNVTGTAGLTVRAKGVAKSRRGKGDNLEVASRGEEVKGMRR
jgi:hypothetical protein